MFLKEQQVYLVKILWNLTFTYSSFPLIVKLSYFQKKVGCMGRRIYTKRKTLYAGILHKEVHHPFTQHVLLIKM